jgi:hypothetical protein
MMNVLQVELPINPPENTQLPPIYPSNPQLHPYSSTWLNFKTALSELQPVANFNWSVSSRRYPHWEQDPTKEIHNRDSLVISL